METGREHRGTERERKGQRKRTEDGEGLRGNKEGLTRTVGIGEEIERNREGRSEPERTERN